MSPPYAVGRPHLVSVEPGVIVWPTYSKSAVQLPESVTNSTGEGR